MARKITKVAAALSLALCGIVANAANADIERNANVLVLAGEQTENTLTIVQSVDGGHSAQILTADSTSLLLAANWQRPTSSILSPGRILQEGANQILNLAVSGRNHQVAVWQAGSDHRAGIHIQGRNNMVGIAQSGQNHSATVTQRGMRNTVAISQR